MVIFLVLATVVAAVAAVTDYRTGQIPNFLTFGGLIVGVVGHLAYGAVIGGPKLALMEGGAALFGVLLCSIAPALMYWKGAMGGGDLKLFAALGALCQPLLGIEAEMYAFVAAAIIAPARLAYEGQLGRVLGNSFALIANPLRSRERRREVPPEMMSWFRLGPAIFLGMIATVAVHGYELFPRH